MSTTDGTRDEGQAALLDGHERGALRGGAAATRFRTEEATRGELVVKVTATGKLQPLNQVDVGSEVCRPGRGPRGPGPGP